MSYADRVLIQFALKGIFPMPAQLQVIDEVDDDTLAAELDQLGDLPHRVAGCRAYVIGSPT